MKKMKKAQFDVLNDGMLAFLGFVLISVLVVITVSIVMQTDLVCDATFDDGGCFTCNGTITVTYNASDNTCHDTNGATSGRSEVGTSAYNGTRDMALAAQLPPQFAQVIVITLIIVGILGLFGAIGYVGYQKLKN